MHAVFLDCAAAELARLQRPLTNIGQPSFAYLINEMTTVNFVILIIVQPFHLFSSVRPSVYI